MRTHLKRLVCLPLLFFLGAGSVLANDQKVFRLNVSPSGYPPYMITDQGTPSGIMWDVVSLIAKHLGYTLEAARIPRKRVDQMLLDGYIDGTFRAREWTDQPENFLFTDAVLQIQEVLFTPARKERTYHSPRDLIYGTVVTHLGYIYPDLQPYFESGEVARFDVQSEKDMFRFLLYSDALDAAVVDRRVGQWVMKNQGWQDKFNVSSRQIRSYDFGLMLRRDATEFASRFNAELARIRASGKLDAIVAKYQ